MSNVVGGRKPSSSLKIRMGYYEEMSTLPIVNGIDGVVRSAVLKRGDLEETREGFHAGELDAALLPMSDAITIPNVQIIPGSLVAAMGASRMMFLVAKTMLPTEIQRVLVDMNDIGSEITARLLLAKKLMIRPEFYKSDKPLNPETYDLTQNDGYDAYLLTGRNSFSIKKSAFTFTMDMTMTWYEMTKLPFVLHLWVIRPGYNIGRLDQELADCAKRNEGDSQLAVKSAERLGIAESGVRQAYQKALFTRFDAPSVQSIRQFARFLSQEKIAAVPPTRIYQPPAGAKR